MDEVFTRIPNPWRTTVSDYEVVPESYSQAVLDPERRKSMMSEGVAEHWMLACVTIIEIRVLVVYKLNVTGKDISYAVGVLCRVLRGCPN